MEVWKDIKGYEGYYQVSDQGRVKSLKRKGCKNDRILKNNKDGVGYYNVNLRFNSRSKILKVHQLVAMHFLGHEPCGYDLVVDHIDNDKLNNNVTNLQLTTVRENTSKDRKGYSSEYIGVSWSKKMSKWKASIWHKDRLLHLGFFTDELEAAKTYQKELMKINI